MTFPKRFPLLTPEDSPCCRALSAQVRLPIALVQPPPSGLSYPCMCTPFCSAQGVDPIVQQNLLSIPGQNFAIWQHRLEAAPKQADHPIQSIIAHVHLGKIHATNTHVPSDTRQGRLQSTQPHFLALHHGHISTIL